MAGQNRARNKLAGHNATVHALVLIFFILGTLLITYPIVVSPGRTLIGGPGDNLYGLWSLWWTRKALLEEGRLPFFDAPIFAPLSLPMMRSVHTFLYGLIYAAGSFWNSNPFLWWNLLVFASFILAGYGTFLLAKLLTGDALGSLIAGAAFSFCSGRYIIAWAHLYVLNSEFVPFYLYFLIRGLREKRSGLFLGAAVFFAATFWNGYYNTFFIAVFTVLLLGLNPALRCFSPRPWGRLAKAAAIGAAAALALISPMLWGLLRTIKTEEIVYYETNPAYCAMLLSYLIPSAYHTVFGPFFGWVRSVALRYNLQGTSFLGYASLLLASYGLARTKPRPACQKFFAISAMAFLLLSFGPYYTLLMWPFGEIHVPMPLALLSRIPFLKDFRVPERMGFMVIFSVAVLAAYGFKALSQRLSHRPGRRALAFAAIVSFVFFEHMHFPARSHFEASDPQVVPPRLASRIRNDSEKGTVLNLPVSPVDYRGVWLQMFHNKPILTGLHSRLAAERAVYYVTLNVGGWFRPVLGAEDRRADPMGFGTPPVTRDLLGAELWSADQWTTDTVRRFCHFFDIRYVLLPPMPAQLNLPDRLRKDLLPLCEVDTEGTAWLAILEPQQERFPLRIDPTSPVTCYYFLKNFSPPGGAGRVMWGSPALLAFRLDRPHDLAWRMELSYGAGNIRRWMTVYLNEQEVYCGEVMRGRSPYDLCFPKEYTKAGYNYVRLEIKAPGKKRNQAAISRSHGPWIVFHSFELDRAGAARIREAEQTERQAASGEEGRDAES